jgi:hypothetical protein
MYEFNVTPILLQEIGSFIFPPHQENKVYFKEPKYQRADHSGLEV